VQEHKNTDVVKVISFCTTVCYNQETYIKALAEESEETRDLEDVIISHPPLDSLNDGQSPKLGYTVGLTSNSQGESSPLKMPSSLGPSDISMVQASKTTDQSGSVVLSLPIPSEISDEPKSYCPLKLELSSIDLGRLEQHERKDCYFTITNPNDDVTSFEILPSPSSPFHFKDLRGQVGAREASRFYLQVVPSTLGRQSHSFTVKSAAATFEVTFIFYVIRASYLRFPDLESALVSTNSHEIDLGPCFINPAKVCLSVYEFDVAISSNLIHQKYAKVFPLVIQNIAEETVVISASSNLSQQCFIFADSQLETYANDFEMRGGETKTVHVALQPYLGSSSSTQNQKSKTSVDKSGIAETRMLIGGLRFAVSVREGGRDLIEQDSATSMPPTSFLLLTQTVKFSALIGMSLLSVSHSIIDLGTVMSKGESYSGSFIVTNSSGPLPIEYRLRSSSVNLQLDKRDDEQYRLEGESVGENDIKITSSSSISFTFKCVKWGFHEERIEVENVNNPSQSTFVLIRLFADMGHVKVTSAKSDGYQRPALTWDDVYVTLHGGESSQPTQKLVVQKNCRSDVLPNYEKSLEIQNLSEELIELQALSDLDLSVKWSLPTGGGFVLDDDSGTPVTMETEPQSHSRTADANWKSSGPMLLLRPKEKAVAKVTVPNPSTKNENQLGSNTGGMLTQSGSLLLRNRSQGVVLKVIEVISSYGIASLQVEPRKFDLGKIGYLNNWQDVKFSFVLTNTAEIPLVYEFDMPNSIDIIEVTDENGKIPSKRKIDGKGKAHYVAAVLRPRLIDSLTAGTKNFDISVLNLFNPEKSSSIAVEALMTSIDLRFERLTQGELVLPSVPYPMTPSSTGSDTWFSITNSTDHETKFELSFDLAPDVSDFIQLEVLSRFSNSPLVGVLSLGPNGTIAVRVRAFPLDDTKKLSQAPNARYLSNSDGVTFGSIRITPKFQVINSDTDDAISKISERIPIRGFITESLSFALSERRVEFRSVEPIENDEISQATSPALLKRTTPKQRETIVITNLSKTRPLHFSVVIEYPLEFPAGSRLLNLSPLDENNSGMVEPDSRYCLYVDLIDTKVNGLSEDVRVTIFDVNTISKVGQTFLVGIVEDTSGVVADDSTSQEFEDVQPIDDDFIGENELVGGEWSTQLLSNSAVVDEPTSAVDDDCNIYSDIVSTSGASEHQNSISTRQSQSEAPK
jgi:hypothetical protein